MMGNCPCGKSRPLAQCCGRFISGQGTAKTPEQLMRSRYTAYFLGNCGEYLLQTWFPATAKGLSAAELSQSGNNWDHLEILKKSQQGDSGNVEFKAFFKSANGELECLHEDSEFKRIKGQWYYVGGVIHDNQSP